MYLSRSKQENKDNHAYVPVRKEDTVLLGA
jgi:hypothetical protein